MQLSPENQRQKLNLLKPRRPASLASRQIARISSSPMRKLGLFVAAFLSGLGLTAVASALQHQTPTSSSSNKQTNSTTITSHQTTGSNPEKSQSYVTINGDAIPLKNGNISRSYTTSSGAHVDLNVQTKHTENSQSSNVIIHSTSSNSENQERGSP